MGDEDEGGLAGGNTPATAAEVDEARYHPKNLAVQAEAGIDSRGDGTQIWNDIIIVTFRHHFLPLVLAGKCASAQQIELQRGTC